MTKKEAAIVSAYTGFLIGTFEDMTKYAEEILSRPIFTPEYASKKVVDELHTKSKDDFCSITVT